MDKNKLYFIRIPQNIYGFEDFVFRETKREAAIYFQGRINKELLEERVDVLWHWKDLMKFIEEKKGGEGGKS